MVRFVSFACLIVASSVMAFAKDDPTSITAVTYNIRYANTNDGDDVWPLRRKAVINYVKQHDVIGLQEVTEPQFAEIRKALTEFDSFGVGRDDGRSGGEHAPIFFRKDRFVMIDKGTFWLSETPDVVGSKGWDAALPRTCTWIKLLDKTAGREIYFANTHFDHRGVNARTNSGQLIADRVNSLPDGNPVVVMGDLNCLPESAPYNAIDSILEDVRTVSASPPVGPKSTWNGFRKIEAERIIDHVFVRSLDVLSVSIDDPKTEAGRFASDHLPVRVILQ